VDARRLGQDEQYLTVREILSEVSTVADGALSRERSDFYRFAFATLGLTLLHCDLGILDDNVVAITEAKITVD
jgi:hypothetical protein